MAKNRHNCEYGDLKMRPASSKPGKQRKYQFNVKKNEIHKILSVHLSPKLREGKKFRSIPVRVGDQIIVLRGNMKGRSGRVSRVDPKHQRIYIDKAVKRKTDNTEIPVPIHPSNCMITKYDEKDRKRLELINRRIKVESEKIDIDSVLSALEEEEDDVVEIDDEELSEVEAEDDVELIEESDETEEEES